MKSLSNEAIDDIVNDYCNERVYKLNHSAIKEKSKTIEVSIINCLQDSCSQLNHHYTLLLKNISSFSLK